MRLLTPPETYEPVYTDKPKYEQQPVYSECPVYKEVPVCENKKTPIYTTTNQLTTRLSPPLVLDLDGDGIETTPQNKAIDINGDRTLEQSSWFSSKEGVLTFDANNNGQIDLNGKELFGDNRDINGDENPDTFANGVEALKALATKNLDDFTVADNVLDASKIRALENKARLRLLVNSQTQKASDYGVN